MKITSPIVIVTLQFNRSKEEEMGRAYRTHGKGAKFVQNSVRKSLKEKKAWKTLAYISG